MNKRQFIIALAEASLISLAIFFTPAIIFSEESPFKKSDFIGFLNGDGSSIEEAVIIKNESDYSQCRDQICIEREFAKNINQEDEFVTKNFGVKGKDWEVAGGDNIEVDIEQNDKFYDKLAIRLSPSREQRTLYFDITDLIIELDKYNRQ